MKNLNEDKIYQNIIIPVLGNVVNVYQALSVLDAVSLKMGKINETRFRNFFHYTRKLSLEQAILCLCKLYDDSNKRYPKSTIFSLLNKIEKDISENTFPVLDKEILEAIEISDKVISDLSTPSATRKKRKRLFLSAVRHANWISIKKNKTLDICFTF